MKQLIKRICALSIVTTTFMSAYAYDFKVGGIYYNKISPTEVEVTYTDYSASNKNTYKGEIIIPEKVIYNGTEYDVTSIGQAAFFSCSSLTSLTIPNSITSIGSAAFKDCSSLTSLTIPNSVTSIGSAFYGCSGLKKVEIESIEWLCRINFEDRESNPLFYAHNLYINGEKITEVNIPTSVTSIGNYTFYGCSGLTSVIIPNSVTSIGVCAFEGCSRLTSVTIPNSVTSIGGSAFSDCSGLTSVTIPNSVTSIGGSAFSDCSGLTSVTIPNSVTSIGRCAFYNCSGLTSVTIPNSVTSIGNYTFEGCSGLTSVTIPNSVSSIGEGAFLKCSNIKSLTLGSGLISIGDYAFSLKSYSSDKYTITKVFWLGNTPPSGYYNVNASVNYVANDRYSFSNQLKYQFLSSKFSVDGTVYIPVSPSERTCDVVDCEYSSQYTDIVITDKVSNRGIEMSVLNINKYAFYDNKYIQSLNISNNGGVGDYSFYGCSALTEFIIPDSVIELGSSAFQNCTSLENISIGTGVPALPSRVLSGCSSLSSLTVPNNIKSIGNYAFSGCKSLGDITIEDSDQDAETNVLTLGSNGSAPLFSDCPLDEVYIGRKLSYETLSYYGYSPFYRNTSLRTVEITDAETQIYNNEFYGCSNLKSLKIGNGVKTIGNWAFSGCSSLDYFSAGYLVESIGKEAFSDCTGLTKYYSYSIVPPVCGDQAMDDINKWECTLYVPDESSDEYKAAPQWKEFFFIDEMDAVLAAEIRLNIADVTLLPEETSQLSAEILPANATDKSLSWSSSDENVATVDSNGLVTAIAAGEATITVRSLDGNAEATCVVTVNPRISDIASISDDSDRTVEVFNLTGLKVADSLDNLAPGIYIVRKGLKTHKIIIK